MLITVIPVPYRNAESSHPALLTSSSSSRYGIRPKHTARYDMTDDMAQPTSRIPKEPLLVRIDKLTSDWFDESNPPKDFADIGLLVPHESLRREMISMLNSVNALSADNESTDHAWKILYLAEWFLDYFYDAVRSHHSNEESIYFPWIATRAALPRHDKISKSHQELIDSLQELKAVFHHIMKKKGIHCSDEIKRIKEKAPIFCQDMRGKANATNYRLLRVCLQSSHATVWFFYWENILWKKSGISLPCCVLTSQNRSTRPSHKKLASHHHCPKCDFSSLPFR